ncbi:MAG: chromate transporter [Erysipelotrichaceae bacterium]|nr:chromate transporter [Erysipelotrichaceae bacterium]
MICLELLLTFFKIGLFTFGGGYAMLPLIEREVISKGWLSEQALVDFLAVSESTPGSFAVNVATYIGSEVAGIPGAMSATFGVVLPSFLIILIVAQCFEKFKSSKTVKGCMSGLKPAVVGLIGASAISVATTVFFPNGTDIKIASFFTSAIIFVLAGYLSYKKVHPIRIILLSALLGILSGVTIL